MRKYQSRISSVQLFNNQQRIILYFEIEVQVTQDNNKQHKTTLIKNN